ncbi:hypothetical protein B0T16DRAFT_386293 [Cercophora newfieldiana]|uniref:Uncharacterized protein n=1 Tax=Cercophora newfieldiana TaxID=92897 RepID=A0AA39YSH9_9PEZI|nr:hypothetical protein B0T16DRAFT_386293 [Cercophora newfieldiana]
MGPNRVSEATATDRSEPHTRDASTQTRRLKAEYANLNLYEEDSEDGGEDPEVANEELEDATDLGDIHHLEDHRKTGAGGYGHEDVMVSEEEDAEFLDFYMRFYGSLDKVRGSLDHGRASHPLQRRRQLVMLAKAHNSGELRKLYNKHKKATRNAQRRMAGEVPLPPFPYGKWDGHAAEICLAPATSNGAELIAHRQLQIRLRDVPQGDNTGEVKMKNKHIKAIEKCLDPDLVNFNIYPEFDVIPNYVPTKADASTQTPRLRAELVDLNIWDMGESEAATDDGGSDAGQRDNTMMDCDGQATAGGPEGTPLHVFFGEEGEEYVVPDPVMDKEYWDLVNLYKQYFGSMNQVPAHFPGLTFPKPLTRASGGATSPYLRRLTMKATLP